MGLIQPNIETSIETSPQLIESLHMAREVALQSDVAEVLPVHLVLAMLEDDESSFLLEAYGVDFKKIRAQLGKLAQKQAQQKTPERHAVFSPGIELIMQHAREQAQKNGLGEVDSNLILAVILSERSGFLEKLLTPYDLDTSGVLQYLELREGKTIDIDPLVTQQPPAPQPAAKITPNTPPTASTPASQAPAPQASASASQAPIAKQGGLVSQDLGESTPKSQLQSPPAKQPDVHTKQLQSPPLENHPRQPAGQVPQKPGTIPHKSPLTAPPPTQNPALTPAPLAPMQNLAPAPAPISTPVAVAMPVAMPVPVPATPPARQNNAASIPDLTSAVKQALAPAPASLIIAPPQKIPLPVSDNTTKELDAPSNQRSLFGKMSKMVSGKFRKKTIETPADEKIQKEPPATRVAVAPANPPAPIDAPVQDAAPAIAPPPNNAPTKAPQAAPATSPQAAAPMATPVSGVGVVAPTKLMTAAANNNQSAAPAGTNLLSQPQIAPATPIAPATTGENNEAATQSIDTLVNPPAPEVLQESSAPQALSRTSLHNRPARRRRTAPASLGAHESLSATGSVLEKGRLVENVPRRMKVNNPSKAEVRITRAQLEEINNEFDDLSSNHIHELSVTEAMTVQLRAPGSGFHIENLSPQTQWIDRNQRHINDADFGIWRWNVTPTTSGKARLQLVISARTVDDQGTIHIADIPDKIIEIGVSADYSQILKRTGLISVIAIIGVLVGRYGETAYQWISKIAAQLG